MTGVDISVYLLSKHLLFASRFSVVAARASGYPKMSGTHAIPCDVHVISYSINLPLYIISQNPIPSATSRSPPHLLTSTNPLSQSSAMGKSRSATLILAYLLSTQTSPTPSDALHLLRHARPMAEPNPGFWSQLELYHRMHCPSDVISNPQYQRWCWEREKARSAREGIPPGTEHIVFEDEAASTDEKQGEMDEGGMGAVQEYRCRRCRTGLGNSEYLVSHTPRHTNNNKSNSSSKSNNEKSHQQQQCAHLFLNPLSWMRPTLSEGHLEGRLECPNSKCKQNVGKYAWQGMKCSCGEWVVPGISVGRGKVDVVIARRGKG